MIPNFPHDIKIRLAPSIFLFPPDVSKPGCNKKFFQWGQSYFYITRKVWYHQIWIQNYLGFIVSDLNFSQLYDFLKLHWIFLSFSVKTYVKEEIGFWSEADTNEIAKSWLKFCNIHKNLVKVMEYDVPEWICPKNMKLALSDIKVSSNFSFNFQISF